MVSQTESIGHQAGISSVTGKVEPLDGRIYPTVDAARQATENALTDILTQATGSPPTSDQVEHQMKAQGWVIDVAKTPPPSGKTSA